MLDEKPATFIALSARAIDAISHTADEVVLAISSLALDLLEDDTSFFYVGVTKIRNSSARRLDARARAVTEEAAAIATRRAIEETRAEAEAELTRAKAARELAHADDIRSQTRQRDAFSNFLETVSALGQDGGALGFDRNQLRRLAALGDPLAQKLLTASGATSENVDPARETVEVDERTDL